MSTATRRAACSCGQLSLAIAGEPARISMCHCLECQRRTGAVTSNQARFSQDQIEVSGRATEGTRKAASGNGVGKVNDCMPNCAQGQFRSYKVKLIASNPVTCTNGKREFSRLAFYFRHKHPGVARKGAVNRPCSR